MSKETIITTNASPSKEVSMLYKKLILWSAIVVAACAVLAFSPLPKLVGVVAVLVASGGMIYNVTRVLNR